MESNRKIFIFPPNEYNGVREAPRDQGCLQKIWVTVSRYGLKVRQGAECSHEGHEGHDGQ